MFQIGVEAVYETPITPAHRHCQPTVPSQRFSPTTPPTAHVSAAAEHRRRPPSYGLTASTKNL